MKRFFSKNILAIIVALIAIIVPIGYIVYKNIPKYEISPREAETLSNDVTVDVLDNGAIKITEKMRLKTSYSEIYKDIYFNPAQAIENGVNQKPQYDLSASATYVKAYRDDGTVIIEGDASKNIGSMNSSTMLQFSWKNGVTHDWYDTGSESVQPPRGSAGKAVSIYLYANQGLGKYVNLEYTYQINGAVMFFGDIAEINWRFATDNNMKTSNVKVTVNLPQTQNSILDKDDVYIYGHGTTAGRVVYDEPFQIVMAADKFLPGEMIEARILFPTYLLDANAADFNANYGNKVNINHLQNAIDFEKNQSELADAEEAENVRKQKTKRLINIISGILIPIIIIMGTMAFMNIYKKFDKEYKSDFDEEYYRELPADYGPAVMNYLYNNREISKNDVSATLLDLIRRGYITINAEGQSLTDAKADYKMIRTSKETNELKPHEKKLLEWFFDVVAGQSNELSLNQLDKFNSTELNALKYQMCNREFNMMTISSGEKEQFFEKPDKARAYGTSLALIIGTIAIVIGLMALTGAYIALIAAGVGIACAIVLASYTASVLKRSQKGNEDYVRWRAFKKFLEEFSNIKDYPMPGIVVWEHYMVYATAFGIADLVEKQLRFKYSQLGLENQMQQGTYLHYPLFTHFYVMRIHNSFRIGNQTITQARASRARSSGGGRGGFGGGSSFGGGGSGMRGR